MWCYIGGWWYIFGFEQEYCDTAQMKLYDTMSNGTRNLTLKYSMSLFIWDIRKRNGKGSQQGLVGNSDKEELFNGCRLPVFWCKKSSGYQLYNCECTSYYWTEHFKVIKMVNFLIDTLT